MIGYPRSNPASAIARTDMQNKLACCKMPASTTSQLSVRSEVQQCVGEVVNKARTWKIVVAQDLLEWRLAAVGCYCC